VLELTVEPDPGQLAPVRHQISQLLEAEHQSDGHIWRVSVVASELLTLSIVQGSHDAVTLRLVSTGDATRVELVDGLEHMSAFDSPHGRLVSRVGTICGVVRDDVTGRRTVWCDVARS
jgi:hypothetical protein